MKRVDKVHNEYCHKDLFPVLGWPTDRTIRKDLHQCHCPHPLRDFEVPFPCTA